MKQKSFTLAFTLAEIMIALVVIGVITSILLPVAFNSVPDENVMKFKKGNATLAKVINELVSSGEYYKEGDLSTTANGTELNSKASYFGCGEETLGDDHTVKYFCLSFAQILNTKEVNCSNAVAGGNNYYTFVHTYSFEEMKNNDDSDNWYVDKNQTKGELDKACKENANKIGAEIVTTDDISFYQTDPNGTFGIIWSTCNKNDKLFLPQNRLSQSDKLGSLPLREFYKPFCMDIDGIGKGEDPFGYGIRVDGKILLGARAQEWLSKSIQDKE